MTTYIKKRYSLIAIFIANKLVLYL